MEATANNTKPLHNIVDIKYYMLAGNATFSVRNTERNTELVYNIEQPSIDRPYFVKAENDNGEMVYIGTLFADGEFKTTTKTKLPNESPQIKVFHWLVERIRKNEAFPSMFQFIRGKTCCKCGLELNTDTEKRNHVHAECAAALEERRKIFDHIRKMLFGKGSFGGLLIR